uniref:myb-like protein P n=1 Tax=Erigeron canadensis TaxID=72917 RepID=UPI001CB89087|nr:myb-like protein P [Erigeron canadensis]
MEESPNTTTTKSTTPIPSSISAAQQQFLMLQQQQQQQQNQNQQQQQFLLLQQIQQQQQQHKQQQAISRFPSNIDAHLRPLQQRPILNHQLQQQQQNPNPNSLNSSQQIRPNAATTTMSRMQTQTQAQNNNNNNNNSNNAVGSQQQQQTPPANQVELQMAYQDAWRVCHPDFKKPFSSLEDACERLLPYHVVADYEAEEDDRILDSDTTGQVLSRTQQWDHSIANKVSEFTATFEKQVLAFNIISRKRAIGEFRSEERLLIEQALLQEERRALFETRAEMEKQQKAGRDAHAANMRMAAMAQAEQARAEMMARAPIRASAMGSMGEQEQEANPDEMMNGWNNNNNQRDEKEPSEDFLNDEERENGDAGVQSDWREGGEFDLNTRQ